MAGGLGAQIAVPAAIPAHGFLFGEDQGRYLVATPRPEEVARAAATAGVSLVRLGIAGGDALTVAGAGAISVSELQRINEAWLPSYMEG
jgi:phosphoribosylformylglycinamidine synthase